MNGPGMPAGIFINGLHSYILFEAGVFLQCFLGPKQDETTQGHCGLSTEPDQSVSANGRKYGAITVAGDVINTTAPRQYSQRESRL